MDSTSLEYVPTIHIDPINGPIIEFESPNGEIIEYLTINNIGNVVLVNGETLEEKQIASVIGTHFNSNEDITEESTTSISFIDKLTLDTDIIPSGLYRIGWAFVIRTSIIGMHVEYVVMADDSIPLCGCSSADPAYHMMAGFRTVELSSGSHHIDIKYRVIDVGTSIWIKGARLEFWRIS